MIQAYEKEKKPDGALLGHGWNPEKWNQQDGEKMLEEAYPKKAVILFAAITIENSLSMFPSPFLFRLYHHITLYYNMML